MHMKATRLNSLKLQRAITQVYQISRLELKYFLRYLANEIPMLFYYKGNNPKMGDNSDKKKYGSLFFHKESIFQNISIHSFN